MFAQIFKKPIPLSDSLRKSIVEDVLARILPARPCKVILFGSFSKGSASEDSDIDVLLICQSDDHIKRTRAIIYDGLKGPIAKIPVDFIYVTNQEFNRKKNSGGVCFIANIEGEIIYEDHV